jgi:hypothetical protein
MNIRTTWSRLIPNIIVIKVDQKLPVELKFPLQCLQDTATRLKSEHYQSSLEPRRVFL